MEDKTKNAEPSVDKMRWKNRNEIEINSPIQGSGYTPNHILKIRESLNRGKLLYKTKKAETNQEEEECVSVHDDNDNDDDDLNIIQTNGWKRSGLPSNVFDSSKSINGCLNYLESSHDSCSNFGVQIHAERDDDLSSIHSVSSSNNSLRNSCVLSNTLKYAQSNSKFKKQLMVNRMRRKRKYEGNGNGNEPPTKKANVGSSKRRIDLMSSRDLKNEIKRIHKYKANTAFNRNNFLLSSSVPNLSRFLKAKRNKQNAPYKSKFDDAATSQSDDDLFVSKTRKKSRATTKKLSRGYLR